MRENRYALDLVSTKRYTIYDSIHRKHACVCTFNRSGRVHLSELGRRRTDLERLMSLLVLKSVRSRHYPLELGRRKSIVKAIPYRSKGPFTTLNCMMTGANLSET